MFDHDSEAYAYAADEDAHHCACGERVVAETAKCIRCTCVDDLDRAESDLRFEVQYAIERRRHIRQYEAGSVHLRPVQSELELAESLARINVIQEAIRSSAYSLHWIEGKCCTSVSGGYCTLMLGHEGKCVPDAP